MTRRDAERLDDVEAAIGAIRDHMERGHDLPPLLDAVGRLRRWV